MLKQGINIVLPIKFTGIDLDDVTQIDFIFKQDKCDLMPVYKTSTYKYDGTGDAQKKTGSDDTINVPWTAAQTYMFEADSTVYMDTKIHILNSTDNPITPIVSFTMSDTLFNQESDDD